MQQDPSYLNVCALSQSGSSYIPLFVEKWQSLDIPVHAGEVVNLPCQLHHISRFWLQHTPCAKRI